MDIIEILKNGGIGIFPTDTLYGSVGSALNPSVVERIYKVRKRSDGKPFIVLIHEIKDLESFGILIQSEEVKTAQTYWPGPVSIILPCDNPQFEYLHRGTKSIAFRLPADIELHNFLKETGPLVAPSANTEGNPPALTIEEAKNYFEDEVDFYVDEGKKEALPSKILKIVGSSVTTLR